MRKRKITAADTNTVKLVDEQQQLLSLIDVMTPSRSSGPAIDELPADFMTRRRFLIPGATCERGRCNGISFSVSVGALLP